jgi:hypothetical protein
MNLYAVNSFRKTIEAKADQFLALLRPPIYALVAMQGVLLSGEDNAPPQIFKLEPSKKKLEEQFAWAVLKLIELLKNSNVHGRRVCVYVSDYWARPLTLPLMNNILKEDEVEIVLKAQFRRRYAQPMDDWAWCWEQQGLQLSAVAWPLAGLNQLRQGVSGQNCILGKAVPLSVDVSRQTAVHQANTWIAIVETASITLIRQREKSWECWLVIPADTGVAKCLSVQLKREAARRNDDCRHISLTKLGGSADMALCRKELAAAGWTVSMALAGTSKVSNGYRLSEILAAQGRL